MKMLKTLLCIGSLFCIADQATARTPEQPRDLKVRAVRLQGKIDLDGQLTEGEWKDDNAITAFVQRDPVEGAAPTEKTVVDVLYDNDAIYVAARMYDSEPSKIVALLGRKDVSLVSDRFLFFVDPYGDKRTGYYFGVNAAGTLYDGTLYNDTWDDNSWDGVWEGKAHIDSKGWTVEMRIPYSQLRFQEKEAYTWGVNFKREIARKNENDYLVYQPKNGNGFVSRFPELTGMTNIKPPRRIELVPYTTAKASRLSHEPGDPFVNGTDLSPGAGMDMKFGLGTNLTLNATVNPDFGQVEVDPAVVNLSDVETFFPEKRPFFVEGSSIFDFGHGGASNYWGFNWSDPNMLYTRRIGQSPQAELPTADFEQVPAGTQILGAAKLTGKLGNSWNVGTLSAITARETAEFELAGQRWSSDVEPMSYYGVYRAQKEFSEGRQALGFMSTLVTRMFHDNQLRDQFNTSSVAAGADGWTFLDTNKTWVLTGWAAFSDLHGTEARMTEVQESARHYFQRPDINYVHLDPNATSLSGYAGRVCLDKEKGNWYVNSAFGFISPGYDINDAGFLWRTDVINSHVGAGYKWTKPAGIFRYHDVTVAAFRSYDFGGKTTWSGFWGDTYMEFKNNHTLDIRYAINPETTTNDTRTRGGPRTLNNPGMEYQGTYNSDSRKHWVFGFTYDIYQSDNSRSRVVGPTLEWKPASSLSVQFNPTLDKEFEAAQWIDNFTDPLATATYGNRYVFGVLDQTTVSSNIRLNWTFSPKLSLQLFVQPLVSAGNYTHIKELAKPGTYDFNEYNPAYINLFGDTYSIDPDGPGPAQPLVFDNPDFNTRALRANAVLRWEYRPGSALYVVWTQSRNDEQTNGNFNFGRSIGRLWSAPADNIFLVKFSYYWNP